MRTTKFALSLTIILLVGGVAGASAFAPVASSANLQPDQVLPLVVSSWEQVNSNGFGDPGAGEVSALGAFNGYLYAGTFNPIDPAPLYDGAQIFRSSDGVTWNPVTQPGFGNSHDTAPPAILDFTVFNSYLYASTGRGNAAKIFRTSNGVNWLPVVNSGFGDPDNMNITALAVYNGKIYAGVSNAVTGAHIWSSFNGDSNSWTQATTPALAESQITGFASYGGSLYAAVESTAGPAQIWRSSGGAWTAVVDDGFGDSDTILTGGLAEFGGYLYAGAGNAAAGAQLWRSSNGVNWTQTITPAFGDSNNQKVEAVFVFQNQLYTSVQNTATGLEVWRLVGSTWEQANLDGFEDIDNTASNWSNATENFLGKLYVGTLNILDGGELWRMQEPYGVALSPDDSLSAPAGWQVKYVVTITNAGTLADSFDLTATGQTWITSLSTSLVSLAPSASAVFSVTVAIPPGVAALATDTVTITATSQGDGSKTDSAVLTTVSTGQAARIFLPALMMNTP